MGPGTCGRLNGFIRMGGEVIGEGTSLRAWDVAGCIYWYQCCLRRTKAHELLYKHVGFTLQEISVTTWRLGTEAQPYVQGSA